MGYHLKDRGSILPAGHIANGAYWYDGGSGKWITSSYYTRQLPQWVVDFNNKKLPDAYLSKPAVDVALQAHVPINDPISFELAALNRLMEVTVSHHDALLWPQFYTEDGSFMYSRSPLYQGKKEVTQFLVGHVKELSVFEKLDIRNDEIDNLGDYVIEYASHIAIIRSGDFSGVFTGKHLRIWRREEGGYLKIFRHIGMYD